MSAGSKWTGVKGAVGAAKPTEANKEKKAQLKAKATSNSWNVETKRVVPVVDTDAQVSISVMDYNPEKFNQSKGKCSDSGSEGDGSLLRSEKPDWAAVRWMNLDVSLDHPGHIGVLTHVLEKSIGASSAALALESIVASGQRARMQFFDGVYFLLSKIPSLPEEFAGGGAGIHRLHADLRDGDPSEGIIEFELIVFLVDPVANTVTTIQVGKEGDVWDALRDSIKADAGGHHDVRNQTTGLLVWNLLNEALRECDHIDESFGAIISPMLSYFEMGVKNVTSEDRRIATALKSEMQAFARQVLPLRDIFELMSRPSFAKDHGSPVDLIPDRERKYFIDLRDKSIRIMDNIQDNTDDTARLLEALTTCDDRRDAKVQFFISVTLAVFSPLSFLVGFYGMNFVGTCEEGTEPGIDGTLACTGGIHELYWKFGYEYIWSLIGIVCFGALYCFWLIGIIPTPKCLSKNHEAEMFEDLANEVAGGARRSSGQAVTAGGLLVKPAAL